MKNLYFLIVLIFSYGNIISQQGLPELIYYKFDNGNSIINDASAPVGTNPTSITGSGLSVGGTGLFGTSLIGTGTSSANGIINTGWATSFTSSFTIGFWTSDVPSTSTLYYIFGDSSAGAFRCFTNGVAGPGNWMMRATGMPDITALGGATATANYIHFVYDAPASQLRSYVDGVLSETVPVTTPISLNGTNLTLGGYASNSNLAGKMDEFRIYNRPLDVAEIQATINGPILGENEFCYSPKDLDLDNLTATTAEFSWTASVDETDGYYWVVMASGEDPDTDLPVMDGNTATGVVTATATQLNQNTAYSIFVQTDCGSEISIWEGPLDFTTPIVPPLNDECTDAFPLSIGEDFDKLPVIGINLGATHDSSDPLPTCDAFNFASNGKDVWYTVDVPAFGNVYVETRTNNYAGMNNTGMEIYSGTCGNLALIECDDNDGNGNFSLIVLSGQTPGETLLVRVWGYNNDVGEFLISAYGDPLPCDKPSNISMNVTDNTIAEFFWSASPTETNGYVWAVMADGEHPDTETPVQSGTAGTGMNTVTVTGLSPTNYYDFYVRANCDSDGMSYWEGPLSFTTSTASVNDHELEGLTFYPNQMIDVLYISAQTEIEKVLIYSLAGQKLIEKPVIGTNTQIDVSNLASAPYFMQVITEKGSVGTYNLIKK